MPILSDEERRKRLALQQTNIGQAEPKRGLETGGLSGGAAGSGLSGGAAKRGLFDDIDRQGLSSGAAGQGLQTGGLSGGAAGQGSQTGGLSGEGLDFDPFDDGDITEQDAIDQASAPSPRVAETAQLFSEAGIPRDEEEDEFDFDPTRRRRV